METVFDPRLGVMVDRRTGLPVDGNATPPQRVNALTMIGNDTGLTPRLNALNQMFNPIVAIGEAGQSARNMLAPDRTGWERVGDLGGMLSGMAGAVAPMAVAAKYGGSAANALVDGITGYGPAAGEFMADEFGGLRLYHGSPHDFDKFSMDKIGTGEGAQAYGHGLYFAEDEVVARNYRDNLSGQQFGTPLVSQDVRGWLDSAGGDYPKAAAEAKAFLREYGDQMGRDEEKTLREAIALLNKGKQSWGHMYEVNVDANPEDFLDWDAPLSAQPQKVRDVMGPRIEALRKAGAGFAPDPDGDSLWRASSPQGGVDKIDFAIGPNAQAAQRLREAGIPGIKYLDAGSRGAGDGSRNYVVFDENLISIVKKYGIAGAATILGMTALDVEKAMAGQSE